MENRGSEADLENKIALLMAALNDNKQMNGGKDDWTGKPMQEALLPNVDELEGEEFEVEVVKPKKSNSGTAPPVGVQAVTAGNDGMDGLMDGYLRELSTLRRLQREELQQEKLVNGEQSKVEKTELRAPSKEGSSNPFMEMSMDELLEQLDEFTPQ